MATCKDKQKCINKMKTGMNSLVESRQICESDVSKMLRSCAASACHRYLCYLEEKKLSAKTAVKRKTDQDGEEIENLKKFQQIEKDIASLKFG
ncbi:hypothetical protein PR048_002538 [Dryococelus australis]|uniref:Uncharacterized protein n=1 Tax=Dryococelus australis TaxID=614101 RepID=A0ABQ9IKL2_9NEOP|nr:hypothetical protein PR048_002538 [Dryococelus australis]